jgi:hypothetical protein
MVSRSIISYNSKNISDFTTGVFKFKIVFTQCAENDTEKIIFFDFFIFKALLYFQVNALEKIYINS